MSTCVFGVRDVATDKFFAGGLSVEVGWDKFERFANSPGWPGGR